MTQAELIELARGQNLCPKHIALVAQTSVARVKAWLDGQTFDGRLELQATRIANAVRVAVDPRLPRVSVGRIAKKEGSLDGGDGAMGIVVVMGRHREAFMLYKLFKAQYDDGGMR